MIRSSLTDQPTERPGATLAWSASSARPAAIQVATHPGTAGLGAIVAGAICAVIAAGGWVVAPPIGWIVGAIGFPGTTMLAWWMSPHAVAATRHGAVGVAAELAVGSILIADALVVGIGLLAAAVGSVATMTVGGGSVSAADLVGAMVGGVSIGILYFLIGALAVGIPVAVIVVPAALTWAVVVRWLTGRGWAR